MKTICGIFPFCQSYHFILLFDVQIIFHQVAIISKNDDKKTQKQVCVFLQYYYYMQKFFGFITQL